MMCFFLFSTNLYHFFLPGVTVFFSVEDGNFLFVESNNASINTEEEGGERNGRMVRCNGKVA